MHLIAIPAHEDGLRVMLGEIHRRYTARINARHCWAGHLWQGRFGSVVMDDAHLAHVIRYVCLNPVRARVAPRAADWRWSSVRAHLSGRSDGIATPAPVRDRSPDFAGLIAVGEGEAGSPALRLAETTGRLLGAPAWIGKLEAAAGRLLAPQKCWPRQRTPSRGR